MFLCELSMINDKCDYNVTISTYMLPAQLHIITATTAWLMYEYDVMIRIYSHCTLHLMNYLCFLLSVPCRVHLPPISIYPPCVVPCPPGAAEITKMTRRCRLAPVTTRPSHAWRSRWTPLSGGPRTAKTCPCRSAWPSNARPR